MILLDTIFFYKTLINDCLLKAIDSIKQVHISNEICTSIVPELSKSKAIGTASIPGT